MVEQFNLGGEGEITYIPYERRYVTLEDFATYFKSVYGSP